MKQGVNLTRHDDVAVIEWSNPPVNAWSRALRTAFVPVFEKLDEDASVRAIILTGHGEVFSAGADINEFATGRMDDPPSLMELIRGLYGSSKLTVAAINGAALGGGLETALACHYRFAAPGARLGLPEVHLGLLPGAGGTQLLPRIVGVEAALDMIVSGRPVTAGKAAELGVVDRLQDEGSDFIGAAVAYARELLARDAPLRPPTTEPADASKLPESCFDDYRASIARRTRGFLAPEKCIQAVETACTTSFEEGLKREAALFRECLESPQARAQQHLFFAQREAGRVPGVEKDTALRTVETVAIIGSGTMGGGIAMCFAQAGLPVTLLDLDQAALERGLAAIRRNYDISVSKGRISDDQAKTLMDRITGTTRYADLAQADLVIEAVFEDMDVKKAVFAALDETCRPGAILATNTSTLDVDEIAASTSRPSDVIGLHFFSPANVMRLLEVVRGAATAPDVIATSLAVARRIGKQAVVVGVCFGFVGNRMLEPYFREAHRLLLEGATPAQVDRVLTDFGMAMGPLTVSDLAGNDIHYLVRKSRRDQIAHDPGYNRVGDRLVELGRNGQKAGRGFYLYEGRERKEDPEVVEIAQAIAAELGVPRREISDQEILERCLYPLINEGAEILREGIACRSGDIDLVWTNGYAFPVWRGGPMQYADEIGPATVLEGMERHRDALGTYGKWWFQPSPLLQELAARGGKFADGSEQQLEEVRHA